MSSHEHSHLHEKTFHEICNYLCGDLDSPFCKEVRDHLDSCPECKLYLDSIKKTVYLFRENEETLKTPPKCKKAILNKLLSLSPKTTK